MENWIEKYVSLLSEKQDKEAFDFKRQYVPSSLFKYRTLNENTLNCLLASSVWMSPALSLNDPYESSLNFNDEYFTLQFFKQDNFQHGFYKQYNIDILTEEMQCIINSEDPYTKFIEICEGKGINRDFSKGKEIRQNLIANFQNNKKMEIRISSFSERNDSVLMWSHYADSHKGICIEYGFLDAVEILQFLEPVLYSDYIFSLNSYLGVEKKKNALRIASITKAKDWQYEKEWRITFPLILKELNSGHFKVPLPKNIFLGTRFNENIEDIKKLLDKMAKQFSIPVIQMVSSNIEYKIIPK